MDGKSYQSIGLKPPRDLNRNDIAILVDPPYTKTGNLYEVDNEIANEVYGFFSEYAQQNPDVRYCVCGWRNDLVTFFPDWNIIDARIGNTFKTGQTESLAFNIG